MSRDYWQRSFTEHDEGFADPDAVTDEFPGGVGPSIHRRRVLQLIAASAALAGLPGCGPSQTPEEITPRVDQAPGDVAGTALFAATAVVQEGYATGAILEHRAGRPVKLEGNPDHPASLGAADATMQASILDLYDPDRSSAVLKAGRIADWDAVRLAVGQKRAQWAKDGGTGLRILTGCVTSPSLGAQMTALLKRYPAARWHQWEPLSRDTVAAGAKLAFGTPVEAILSFENADVVLGIESDAISSAPGHLAFARAFAARRRAAETGTGTMNRVYAIEATPTLLGAVADHRFVLKPSEIENALRSIAAGVGAAPAEWASGQQPGWADAMIKDLLAHRGGALVHAGPEQSAAIHALVHAINSALNAPGRTVRYIAPAAIDPGQGSGIGDLVADMQAGKVDTLLIVGGNPVYDAPGDLGFAAALARVPLSIQLAIHVDETAQRVTFHIPQLHPFEDWSDARAFDGSATILQPQILPLVSGHSALSVLALLAGPEHADPRSLIQDYWRGRTASDFDAAWTSWLRKGIVADTAAADAAVHMRPDFVTALPKPAAAAPGLTLLLRPDPFLRDGSQANNGWLQELPRPFTRLTWDNAALIAPATAKRVGIANGDVVEATAAGHKVRLPAMVLPGQAADCIGVTLGYGRRAIGGIGTDIGSDVSALRASSAPWQAESLELTVAGERMTLATTQHHQDMEGRDIVRTKALDDFLHRAPAPKPSDQSSLYPPHPYPDNAWGMAISLNSCIGCGACTAACQAENNIPVVGRDEVIRGRAMHWIRVDRYWGGEPETPDILFQPVPCMHCEDAPCEVVCPVGATVHDSDGLNAMVYNRCVGTRFCSNNCPYKVRRFNFYGYAGSDKRPAMSWNPDVTVRSRGVMEKCTYCIQRIRETKIAADRENRAITDGEIKTACQQACPTEAIVFGDINNPQSEVSRRKASPLDYALLGELNTRPRTTYAARLTNRNPEIGEG